MPNKGRVLPRKGSLPYPLNGRSNSPEAELKKTKSTTPCLNACQFLSSVYRRLTSEIDRRKLRLPAGRELIRQRRIKENV